jgi:sulfite reductase beta subunit-like hemoprotein
MNPADRHAVETTYDSTVREDIEFFREKAKEYTNGQLTADQFRPHRLRRGIYTQRQPDVHMIRTKVPGGIVTVEQMRRLADVASEFAGGKAHLTTRQNVQYHFIPLLQVPDLLHRLADVRLTTREACYNTVRNVTACPYAGLIADEPFDVRPYARITAFAFLHKDIADNLPRKFKIAFSGGHDDSVATDINDLGLRAVIKDGQRGFRVTIGGGLGPLPNEPAVLDEFLPVERIVNRAEAVIRVFGKHGNRSNKNKARLKFVLRERGFAWVKEQVEIEYQDILQNGGVPTPTTVPDGFGGFEFEPVGHSRNLPVLQNTPPEPGFDDWARTNREAQKDPAFAIATIKISQGNLTASQMHAIADIAEQNADGQVRLTMTQNLLIANIPAANVARVYAGLRAIGLADAGAREIEDITNCPGAYSCNLALTKSMNLGEALAAVVTQERDPLARKLQIHISGCPNSCGQHWTGDFGFYGNARKIEGREVPYYQMLLGGGYDENRMMRYGFAIQSIPARFVTVAVQRVLEHYKTDRQDGETFRQYVQRNKVEFFRKMTADLAKPAELFPELYQDWGDDVSFSLQLGRGECAA